MLACQTIRIIKPLTATEQLWTDFNMYQGKDGDIEIYIILIP